MIPIFTAMLTMIVPAIAIAASSAEIAAGCSPPRVMIAVSTSVRSDDQQQHGDALLAEPPAAHFAATAATATNSDEAERRNQRDRIAGRGRRIGFGRLAIEPQTGAPGDRDARAG